MLRFTPALTVFAVVLLDAPFARAERPRRPSVRLEYERKKGAARCPDEASLRAHVAAQLGRDPFTPEGSWRVVASVARRGAGFVANMEAFENDGKAWSPGPIADPSCARLVNEILALSIAIELSEPPTRPPEPPPAALPIAATAPPADQPRAPAVRLGPQGSGTLRLRLAFSTGVEIGVGPTPSPVFALAVGVRWSFVSVALEGRTDLPLTGTGEGRVPVQGHVAAGSLLGCLHASALHAYGCGLLALGVQRASDARSPSSHSSTAYHSSTVYAATGGRVGLEFPFLSRFAVHVAGDVLATFNPITIRSNLRNVWQAAPVAGIAQGGLVAYF
jgi:hypothetical protein